MSRKRESILRPNSEVTLNARRYKVVEFIRRGGSGEVYKIRDKDIEYALKLFFPFYYVDHNLLNDDRIIELEQFQEREYQILRSVSHPNIVTAFDSGAYNLRAHERVHVPTVPPTPLPFLIEAFIDGTPLDTGLATRRFKASDVARILLDISDALSYIHDQKGYMHADLKADNIMLRSSDSSPILIDFGLSKNLNFAEVSPSTKSPLLGDWGLFPQLPQEHPLMKIKESRAGASRQDLFDLAFPTLDLFDFGRMLQPLRHRLEQLLDPNELAYLDLLISQLTDWDVVRQWKSSDLRERIGRLSPDHYTILGLSELTAPTAAKHTIMIPPGVGVPLSARVRRIVEHPSFRRLAHINQLSLLFLLYPAADYKRMVHVLSCYHLSRQFVTHLFSSPAFRLDFGEKEVLQLMVLTLLHDINHFPFLHTLQESDVLSREFDLLGFFCDGRETKDKEAGYASRYEIASEVDLTPGRLRRILFDDHETQLGPAEHVMSSMINSAVDIDKMSYLPLDGQVCGVPYGRAIDLSVLLKSASVGPVGSDENRLHLVFSDRGIQAVEAVIMARYWNFRAIYWHHTNRAIMAMLLAVFRAVYMRGGRDVTEYLRQTMWMGDAEALKYLDREYYQIQAQGSMLHGLLHDRRKLYRRLYTVRTAHAGDPDQRLYEQLEGLEFEEEEKFCAALGRELREYIRSRIGREIDIVRDEVLLDVPRRKMDSVGDAFIRLSGSEVRHIKDVSATVANIGANYQQLAKRARIFVSPRVAEVFEKEERRVRALEIRGIIQRCLNSVTSPPSQVA